MNDQERPKPVLLLRQLVCYSARGVEFRRGETHAWRKDADMAVCGRRVKPHFRMRSEPSSLPLVTCAVCLRALAGYPRRSGSLHLAVFPDVALARLAVT